MKRQLALSALAAALLWSTGGHAALEVLACEPEWGALVTELAGAKVRISVATTPRQNPHHIEARPSLIARARRADLVVCTGADLELGWLPLLQRESGNAKIQTGQAGWFEAARYVDLIEKPATLDRAHGDVHAAGNPHFLFDPRTLPGVAAALATRLQQIDPVNAAHYGARLDDFQQRWEAAVAGWERRGAPLRGVPVAVQHKTWSYLIRWLGMETVVDLEPKSGVEPSAVTLAEVARQLEKTPARMVLRANHQSPRPSQWLEQRAGVKAVELPFTVGASERATDLFGLFDDLIGRLLEAQQ